MARRYLDDVSPYNVYEETSALKDFTNTYGYNAIRNGVGELQSQTQNSQSKRTGASRSKRVATKRSTARKQTRWTPMTKSQALKSLGDTEEITVKAGQSLSSIDKNRWREIAIANEIKDPNKIYAGQRLTVPKNRTSTQSNSADSSKQSIANTAPQSTNNNVSTTQSVKNTTATDSTRTSSTTESYMRRQARSMREAMQRSANQSNVQNANQTQTTSSSSTTQQSTSQPNSSNSNHMVDSINKIIGDLPNNKHSVGIRKNDILKDTSESALSRGWNNFINSLVPSVNTDPSGGYHAYTNEQYWKDKTGTEMPGTLRQTVGQNLLNAAAGAGSLAIPAALSSAAGLSDAVMATRGGKLVANVLTNPYVRAAGTAYGLSRLPWDIRDGNYINTALDVIPFGSEAWNAARSIATGANMTKAGNWFGFAKTTNPWATRVSNPIDVNTTATKVPFKPTTTTTQTRFPIWYLRGKMPMYNPYTGTTEFVNSNVLEGSYNQLGIWARQALPYGKERMPEPYPTSSRALGFRPDVNISPVDQARAILQGTQSRVRLPYVGIRTAGYTSPNSVGRPGTWRVPQLYDQPVTIPNPVDPAVGKAAIMQNPQLGAHSMQPQLLPINNYFPNAGTTQFEIPSAYNTPRFFPTERRMLPTPTKGQVKTPRKPRANSSTNKRVTSNKTKGKTTKKRSSSNNAQQLTFPFRLGGVVPLF